MDSRKWKMTILGTCASLFLIPGAVLAKDTTLRMAHIFSSDHIFNEISDRFMADVKAASDGDIDIKYYPGGTLGDWEEMVDQVQQGQLQMTLAWNASELDPTWDIAIMGFLVDDWEAAYKMYYENPEMTEIYDGIVSNLGMKLMGVVPIDFRGYLLRKGQSVPDSYPDGAKGLKMRIPGWSMAVKRYEALGFSPLTMSFSGLHTALQTGAVDGAAYQPPAQIPSFSNVTGSFVNTREDFEHGFWLVNQKWYDDLSDEQRAVIDKAADDAVRWSWEKAEEMSEGWLQEIDDSNVEIVTLSDEQRAAYKELVTKAEHDYLQDVVGADMLDNIFKYAEEANAK